MKWNEIILIFVLFFLNLGELVTGRDSLGKPQLQIQLDSTINPRLVPTAHNGGPSQDSAYPSSLITMGQGLNGDLNPCRESARPTSQPSRQTTSLIFDQNMSMGLGRTVISVKFKAAAEDIIPLSSPLSSPPSCPLLSNPPSLPPRAALFQATLQVALLKLPSS
jgi:hypothetical protein